MLRAKKKYNGELLGLRAQEKEVLKAQQKANHTDLKADYAELADVLKDNVENALRTYKSGKTM
jgi:hypothetical protein